MGKEEVDWTKFSKTFSDGKGPLAVSIGKVPPPFLVSQTGVPRQEPHAYALYQERREADTKFKSIVFLEH